VSRADPAPVGLVGRLWRKVRRVLAIPRRLAEAEGALARLQSQQATLRGEVDWLLPGMVAHNDRLDSLDELLPLRPLVFDEPPPFVWRGPRACWLEAAEERLGVSSALKGADRDRSFYSFFSEMGGDHRPILHQQYRAYLPLLRRAVAATDGRVLDIGCGAGELLQFLKGEGVPAIGVDMDPVEIGRAREQGLAVVQAEVGDYLSDVSERFAAITLFQVIEHIPPDQIEGLLQRCVDCLLPGGALLVETLNLRHPLAMNGFYTDPTHKTPLADSYLAFLLQWIGLQGVDVIYTLPVPIAGIASHEHARLYMNYTVCGWAIEATG